MKRTPALILALLMLILSFAACGSKPEQTAEETPEKDEVYGVYHDYFSKPPTTLNNFVDTDTPLSTLTYYCQALLYNDVQTSDGKGWEWYCELAEDFPQKMDEEGKVWRITMKKGLKWANGDPLTADDYIYSVRMLVDPLQVNVSNTALTTSVYMQIVNLYEYSKGECAWEDVGIKKIDDLTFELTSTYGVPEINVKRFVISSSLVYKPLYDAGLSADGTITSYGTSVDQYNCCGPFKIVEWIPDAKFTLVRNENYVYADQIHLEGIDFKVVPDAETAIQLFIKGELDYCTLAYSDWEKFEDDPRVYEYFNDSLMYMFVNLGNPSQNNILGSHDYREAINHGCDRIELADTLDVYPVSRYVRRSVIGNAITGKPFVDFPADYVPDPASLYDPALAKEYLAKAFEEKGLESATIEFLQAETATINKAVNEMLQKQYDTVFEGKLKAVIRQVPNTLKLRRWNPEDPTSYEISIGSMLPSSGDPRASFKTFISSYNPPRVYWNNPEYDALYDKSLELDLNNEEDADEIISLCQQMEKILLDDLVIIPLYEKPDKVLFSERVHLPVEDYIVGYGFGKRYITLDK